MNRADPFNERDATGWQLMNLHTGRVDVEYTLYDNTKRTGSGSLIGAVRARRDRRTSAMDEPRARHERSRLRAMPSEAYIAKERRGVPIEPGKH
jgi:ribosomal protein L19E